MTAGTILQDTRTPLTTWFRAIWWVSSQRTGASAVGLKEVLGLGSYETTWTWLHKLRRAMMRPGPDRLSGVVEIDETYLGAIEEGVHGRQTVKKALMAVAAEEQGTPQGAISHAHLDYSLDEFPFRFNRRRSRHRGKLFYRLLQQAMAVDPVPYRLLVKGVARPKHRYHNL